MNYILEKERKTLIFDECDVLVAGGGVGGIAAALAASRNGAKVILVEKQCVLGGLATSGLITIYLPLCDGMGRQVIYGIAEELLRLSIKYGYEDRYPDAWLDDKPDDEIIEKRKIQRFLVQYNPHLFAIAAEQTLADSGVRILYDTLICDVQLELEAGSASRKISAVIVESREGRYAIKAGAVVDATGDANVCHLAEAETEINKKGNPLAAWYYYASGSQVKLKQLGAADARSEDNGNGRNNAAFTGKRYTGLGLIETSDMIIESHKAILSDILKQREKDPACILVTIAAMPQFRMTRRLAGEYHISKDDVFKRFDDSVGLTGDWRTRGPVYEIPFGSLYTKKVKNLAVAGRCISVTDEIWDVTRVIPTCAVTGEAAGTAAAITRDFATIDIGLLQDRLQRQGVKLHLDREYLDQVNS